jgi:hypothetical protein
MSRLSFSIKCALDGRKVARQVMLASRVAEPSAHIQLTGGTTIDVPAPQVELATIEGIEMVGVGFDWPGLNGKTTITEQHLIDAVEAANSKLVTNPRFGLGHEQDLGDKEPAFGKYTNVRLSEDGQTMLGDLEGVPVWVSKMLPTAYPGRSIEGRFNQTYGNKNYSLIVDAVKCLGIRMPACSVLADLPTQLAQWFGSEPPAGVEVDGVELASTVRMGEVDDDAVKRAFWYDFCVGERADWWPRSQRVDDAGNIRIIAESDKGDLYSVPVTVGSDSAISFGEPTPVVEQYVAASAAPTRESVRLAFNTRDEARANLSEEGHMDPKELRRLLGLAEDASDDDVKARTTELSAAAEAAKKVEDEKPAEEKPAPAATLAASGDTVTLDKGQFDLLMSTAQTVQAIQKAEAEKKRDASLSAAVGAGKIPPARKAHWSSLWDKDPEGTETALAALTPGLIPVGPALGGEGAGEDDSTAYDPSILTAAERQRIEAANAAANGKRPLVTFSGSEG